MAQLAYWHNQVNEMRQFMNRLSPPVTFKGQEAKLKMINQIFGESSTEDEENFDQQIYHLISQISQDDYQYQEDNEIFNAVRPEGNHKVQNYDTTSSVRTQALKNAPCIKFSSCPDFQKDQTGSQCKFGHNRKLYEQLIEKAKDHIKVLEKSEKVSHQASKGGSLTQMQQESVLQLMFNKAQAEGRENLAKVIGEVPADTTMKIVELGQKQSPAYTSGLIVDDSDEGGRH
jgi:hypothetical protein